MKLCNWPGCDKTVPEYLPEPFCSEHWHGMTMDDKRQLAEVYRRYAAGELGSVEARDAQAAVLKTYLRKGKP